MAARLLMHGCRLNQTEGLYALDWQEMCENLASSESANHYMLALHIKSTSIPVCLHAWVACKLRKRDPMTLSPYDVYLKMHSAWRDGIPKRLQGVEPSVLITILKLVESEEGISQSAVQSALGLTQWGLSKIKRKLVRENWVKVWRPESDRRRLLMSATPKARLAMGQLQVKLIALLKLPVASKPHQKKDRWRVPSGAGSLLDPAIEL